MSEKLHVLAVDDSTVDLKLIERMLRRSSIIVTAVDSPTTALELLGLDDDYSDVDESELLDVDLIITDYCMPEMSGLELLQRVKESSSLRDIPVVVVSSDYIPNRIRRCMDEGAEDFLLKPLKQSELSRLCSRILKQSRM